jgi:hypothetical protein
MALIVAQNLRFYYQKANDFWDKKIIQSNKVIKGIHTKDSIQRILQRCTVRSNHDFVKRSTPWPCGQAHKTPNTKMVVP